MAYLLKPLQAGHLSLANRLIMPPMATYKTDDGSVTPAILDYYREKSQGGYLSLVIIEHSYVSKEGRAQPKQLSVATDDLIPSLKTLAAVIQQNGSKAVVQINHAGSKTTQETIGTIPVAPSAVPHPSSGIMPRELTKQEIAGIVQSFRDAALRVKAAGFDGVEIHSAHGYLLNQFFSPLTNHRNDEYGGTLQNRIRLHLEIIKTIRAAVGPDFPLLLRLGACDYQEGGITIEDSQSTAVEFSRAGLDIIDISGSFLGYNAPPGVSGQGYFSDITGAIKQAVSIPVILTGGITTPQAAEQLLAEGKSDLIGVGRAVMQDSQWAKRAIESFR